MRTLNDALQTASAIHALKTLKLSADQQDQIALADEIYRLRASNAELVKTLGCIADSVAIGAASSAFNKSMQSLFSSIEEAASAAIAKATS